MSDNNNEKESSILNVVDITRVCSIEKFRRITGYVLRFVLNLKAKMRNEMTGSGRLTLKGKINAEKELS